MRLRKYFFYNDMGNEPMKKADYSKIASFYDKGRIISDQNIEFWLGLVKKQNILLS